MLWLGLSFDCGLLILLCVIFGIDLLLCVCWLLVDLFGFGFGLFWVFCFLDWLLWCLYVCYGCLGLLSWLSFRVAWFPWFVLFVVSWVCGLG